MKLIEELVSVDNNIHIKELFLLVACKLALGEETKDSVQIISARATNIDFYSKQILYMENSVNEKLNKRVNKYIGKNYLFISRTFKEIGLDFFYLPHLIEDYQKNETFVQNVMNYLVPTYSETKNKKL